MCLACMILIILTKPIAAILFRKEFYQAWQYVPFLLVAGVFNSASGVLGPILNANKNSKSLGLSSLVGTLVNVILNFCFVLVIGPQGAAIATAISSYVIFILRKIALKKQVDYKKYWKLLLSWILIVVQAGVEIYVSNYIIELGVIIMMIVINRLELKEFFSQSSKMLKHYKRF